MRRVLFASLLSGVFAAFCAGQSAPGAGSLIFMCSDTKFLSGRALCVSTLNGQCATLAVPPSGFVFRGARMAPNNRDIVTATLKSASTSQNNVVMGMSPTGALGTITSVPGGASPHGFELDDDGWVMTGNDAQQSHLWSIRNNRITTLFSRKRQSTGLWGDVFFDVAIDRDFWSAGAPPYVISLWQDSTVSATSRLLHADRRGVVSTVYAGTGDPLRYLQWVELDPATGDYLVCGVPATSLGHLCFVGLVSKTGATITTLQQGTSGIPWPFQAKILQDRTAWVSGYTNASFVRFGFYRIDLNAGGKVITMVSGPSTASGSWALGLEVYGSRRVVCAKASPSTIEVDVHSAPAAPGSSYQLAASFSRRPGLRLPNGEWLHLDVLSDPLFTITARNLLPTIFERFQGTLDAFGDARARVIIPAPLVGQGFVIFVAGVIYDRQPGALQVTNTHWFVT